LSKLVQVSALQFLTVELTAYCVLNVNCQAQLGEILQWHQHTNPAFSINMLSHTLLKDIHRQNVC